MTIDTLMSNSDDHPNFEDEQSALAYLSKIAYDDEPLSQLEDFVKKSSGSVQKVAHKLAFYEKQMEELVDMSAEGVRMESDLFMARTVQDSYMPLSHAKIGSYHISGFNVPASEVSGDWWYYTETPTHIFLWIGDATGHGIAPALLTCAANSAMSIIRDMTASPAAAMEVLNTSLYNTGKGSMMMTAFAIYFEKETGNFSYSVASHDPPFIIRNLSEDTKMKDFEYLNENNSSRLGEKDGSKYTESHGQLDDGEILILTTDGIPEMKNPEGEELGERKFSKSIINSLLENRTETQHAAKAILKDLYDFKGFAEQEDDLTLIICTKES